MEAKRSNKTNVGEFAMRAVVEGISDPIGCRLCGCTFLSGDELCIPTTITNYGMCPHLSEAVHWDCYTEKEQC